MTDEKINGFIQEINSIIGPVIEIKRCPYRQYPHFELILAETSFVMRDQVVLNMDDKFSDLVTKVGVEYFGITPHFNNTGRIFFFLPGDTEK